MIIVPGDAVTCAMIVAAEVASEAADSELATAEVAGFTFAIEASDATTARSCPPTHGGTRVRHISVRMFEWPPLLAPPRSRRAAVI
jgi:hypothetical protein